MKNRRHRVALTHSNDEISAYRCLEGPCPRLTQSILGLGSGCSSFKQFALYCLPVAPDSTIQEVLFHLCFKAIYEVGIKDIAFLGDSAAFWTAFPPKGGWSFKYHFKGSVINYIVQTYCLSDSTIFFFQKLKLVSYQLHSSQFCVSVTTFILLFLISRFLPSP